MVTVQITAYGMGPTNISGTAEQLNELFRGLCDLHGPFLYTVVVGEEEDLQEAEDVLDEDWPAERL